MQDSPEAAQTLAALAHAIDGKRLVASALSLEAIRQEAHEALLASHHGFAIDGITTTPFMYQAAVVARERGVFAFNRLERHFLQPHADWVHPDIGAGYFRISRPGERLVAPNLWPFRQDCPLGDFEVSIPVKWLTHGLVHALVGFGWWPGMSEWDVMHMARLSEAVAALHYYWLSELGRASDDSPVLDLSDLGAEEGAVYAQLELEARDPKIRLERLRSERCRMIADNAVATLRYEATVYNQSLTHGVLMQPEGKYLGVGESCDYAKVHHPRLMSASFRRYLDTCLQADDDYATSWQGFERRCADVVRMLLTPQAPSDDVTGARAGAVLRDVGQRLCHAAALQGRPTDGFSGCLDAVGDAIQALRGDVDAAAAQGLLAETLARVAADVASEADDALARRVLTLGYNPGLGSEAASQSAAARESAIEAVIDRAWQYHAVVGVSAEGARPVVARMIDAPRERNLIDELMAHADPAARAEEIGYSAEAFIGWLKALESYWGPPDGSGNVGSNWGYRLGHARLPERDHWGSFVIEQNPGLTKLPYQFNTRWAESVVKTPRGQVAPLKPKPLTAVEYCLTGPGRKGPLFVLMTPKVMGLWNKLKLPRRLDDLMAMSEVDEEAVSDAVAEGVLLCLHKPLPPEPEEPPMDLYELAAELQSHSMPGPWNEEDQAAAYDAFEARSSLYRDTSRQLVERLGIEGEQRVAELGSGTGTTSLEILARLGEGGLLFAVDSAKRMVEAAQRRVQDPRVEFSVGSAHQFPMVAAQYGAFHRAACNAALWLSPDISRTVRLIRSALVEGGRFGFSIPAAFIGHTEYLTQDSARDVSNAIIDARAALELPPPEAPAEARADVALGTVDAMRAALEGAGFADSEFTLWNRPWSMAEYLDWIAMPVVVSGMLGAEHADKAEAFIDRLRASLDPDAMLDNAWYFVVSRAG